MRRSRGLNPNMADGLTSEEACISECEQNSHDLSAVIAIWLEPRYPTEYTVDARVCCGRFYSSEHAFTYLNAINHPILQLRILQMSLISVDPACAPVVIIQRTEHSADDVEWFTEEPIAIRVVHIGTPTDAIIEQYPVSDSSHYRVLWLNGITT